jgi:hypothetical protein
MIVNWDIQSWEGGSASLVANVDEIERQFTCIY